MSKSRTNNIATGLVGILTAACMASSAYAVSPLPTGGSIVGGAPVGTIATVGSTTTVNQKTERMIANWNSFDIASGYTVEFKQPNSTSVALNRIGGANASQIYGTLKANGNVILINQSGIHFGPSAQVKVGSLIATTSKMSNEDFWDAASTKNYKFTKGNNPSAQIVNEGNITAADGGLVALVAPTVKNSGVITARMGKVEMASGDSFTVGVDLYGDGLLSLQASDDIKKQVIENSGTISANGGEVLMTAAAAKNVVDSLINMDGLIEAKSIGIKEGQVTLEADVVNVGAGGKIYATGLNEGEKGGDIEIDAEKVTIGTGARMIAAGYKEGGEIDVDATKDIVINENALLCAKSITANNGGDIKLDGGSVAMKPGSRLNTTGGELKISGTNPSGTAKNGVTLNGATLTAGSGKITIEGKGTENAIVGSQGNHGVKIYGGSVLRTTGAGSISIKGTGGNGGYTDFNTGVFVTGNNTLLSTEGGSLTIEGFGGGKDWSAMAHGIVINDNAAVTSDSGKINLAGIAGGGCNCSYDNWGVAIMNAKVKTNSGDIAIYGQGGDNAAANKKSTFTDNYGVIVGDRGEITSASGNIDITGVGGGDKSAARRNYGIYVKTGAIIGTHSGDALDTGHIRFVADTLEMDNSAKINTTNTVFFEPYTDSTTIGVAGAAGTLQIDNDVLSDIKKAGHITIGNTNRDTGLLTANAYTWQAGASLLNKDGNINIDGNQNAQGFTFLAHTVNGDITINKDGGVVGVGSGSPIVLAASNGSFNNFSGADALSAPNGRWLVFSGSPMTDRYDGLTADFHRYGQVYNGTLPSASGNGFIYSVTPVLTVAANNEHVPFGGDAPVYSIKSATEKYTFKGVTYDLIGTAFSDIGDVSLSSPYTKGDSIGNYPINPIDTKAATVGYTFNPIPGTLTVDGGIDPHNVLERWKGLGKRAPNGILLAIVNTNEAAVGNLADLAPAAGGNNPQRLADLAPKAGGNTGITPLVQCDQNTPCDINQ